MSASGEEVIRAQGVSKIYREGEVEVRALSDVSIGINRGAFMAIAGPSGSGKSTLLNLMGGLDRPFVGFGGARRARHKLHERQ